MQLLPNLITPIWWIDHLSILIAFAQSEILRWGQLAARPWGTIFDFCRQIICSKIVWIKYFYYSLTSEAQVLCIYELLLTCLQTSFSVHPPRFSLCTVTVFHRGLFPCQQRWFLWGHTSSEGKKLPALEHFPLRCFHKGFTLGFRLIPFVVVVPESWISITSF